MSETTARICLLKFCQIVSRDELLQSVFARKMTRADAQRVSTMHEAVHGMAGMISSLDSLTFVGIIVPLPGKDHRSGKRGSQEWYWKLLRTITCGSGSTH
jgi:hypothetical protein